MRKFLFVTYCVCWTLQVYGQLGVDSIETRSRNKFFRHGQRVDNRQLFELCKDNPEAYREMKLAKNGRTVATVCEIAGGFCLGWTAATAISGKNPAGALAGAGVVLMLVSIPFTFGYHEHVSNAVNLYNRGMRKTAMNPVKVNVGLASNGFRLRIAF